MASKNLFFATTNPGKLNEAQRILRQAGVAVLSLADFPKLKSIEIEETGSTFAENAYLKAKAFGELSQVLTLAEDAGLVVDALDGKPGVRSARFAANDQARIKKLLRLMKGKVDRQAKFVSVLALYDPKTEEIGFFKGVVRGKIADQAKGKGGFGYDPVFIPEGYERTFGELGDEVKNEVSHRGRALEKLIASF